MPPTRGTRGTRITIHLNPWLEAYLANPPSAVLVSDAELASAEAVFAAVSLADVDVTVGTFTTSLDPVEVEVPDPAAGDVLQQHTVTALERVVDLGGGSNHLPSIHGTASQLLRLAQLPPQLSPEQLTRLILLASNQATIVLACVAAHYEWLIGEGLGNYQILCAEFPTEGAVEETSIRQFLGPRLQVVRELAANQITIYDQRLATSELATMVQIALPFIAQSEDAENEFSALTTAITMTILTNQTYGACMVYELMYAAQALSIYADFLADIYSFGLTFDPQTYPESLSDLRAELNRVIDLLRDEFIGATIGGLGSNITSYKTEIEAATDSIAEFNTVFEATATIDALTSQISGHVAVADALAYASTAVAVGATVLGYNPSVETVMQGIIDQIE